MGELICKGFSGADIDARVHYCYVDEDWKPFKTVCRLKPDKNLRRISEDSRRRVDCKLCLKKDLETDKDETDKKPMDYCEIGMSRCVSCGWIGKYPVSGCPCCSKSFVS